ncbi:AAA family ATPase [Archangium primigenium]|uniref:AAA family ATPase n=1 Tax=[Archangium] primigenium TaxID=2792470 RepID=UPI00195E35C8|nr:AAA family ATPase [Archangium primigenium]MBM7116208.1 ATP-dependent Clp protease ATP-binding subunit [Archangium primigenium]
MNFMISVYQRRDSAGGLSWTTLGLGPHTQARTGRGAVKLQQKIVEELRTLVGKLPVHELAAFQLSRGVRLERIPLELDFKRLRVSGAFPLILEPRWRTRGESVTIAYHPERQGEWFTVEAQGSLAEQARAFFTHAWSGLEAPELESLRSNRKDSLKVLSFEATPRSPLELLGKRQGPWADLDPQDRPGAEKKHKKSSVGGTQVLHTLGTNLTLQAAEGTLAAGMPRAPYRDQLQWLLGGERKTPVLLVGPPGCGKRTLLKRFVVDLLESEGYATHHNLDKVSAVWTLAGKRIIAGMSYVGDWEQRCLQLLEDVRGRPRVLLVEDLHAFGRIGRTRDSDTHLALFFQGALARGEILLVGTVTPEQLQRLEADAPSFAALFTQLHVRPTAADETLRMLLHESRELEVRHQVRWHPLLFPALLEQASALFAGAALPGKAIDTLRELATRHQHTNRVITSEELFAALADRTGLPPQLLSARERLMPEDVREALARKVMGQPAAMDAACDLVLRIHAGLTDPQRPYGVYLFTGPTGTGKTELARALAHYLYGDASRLVRLDMAEFQSPEAVARLTGDAWNPEGRLTRLIREQPFSLVLLDEIEKAHPSLLHLLLQVFDEGRLTDASGETADFTHAVLVMTSNLGARRRPRVGLVEADARAQALEADRAVREFFPPELFNRIDRVVYFSPLSREVGEQVVEKELARLLARQGLTSRNIFVSADDAVKRRIVEESFDPHLGARPLKRYLEEHVGQVLAEAIIRGPQSPLRLFQLYLREGHFEVQADALIPREPVAEGFALEPLLSLPMARLRETLREAREDVRAMRESEALGALSEQVRFHLDRLQAGEREHAESLYTLDAMRMYLEHFAAQLDTLSRAPEEDAREMIEVERFGLLEVSHANVVRLFDRRSFAPVRTASREQMLDVLAEVYFLRRILRGLASPEQHLVQLELLPLGQWRRGATSGSQLTRWLCTAYAHSRGTIESFAVLLPNGARVSGGARQLREFLHASTVEPVHAAIKLVGPGIRPFLEGESGLHVWQSSGRLPEIVKVRVHPADAPAPPLLLASHAARLQAFHEARQQGLQPLPEDPEAAMPVVRAYRFEPPSRQQVAELELDDYLLTYSGVHRVRSPADALPTLWRLRMSQNPSGTETGGTP